MQKKDVTAQRPKKIMQEKELCFEQRPSNKGSHIGRLRKLGAITTRVED